MRIELVQGDITTLDVDAIVNPANSQLRHGGGVAGAIVRRGGPGIQEESDRIGFVPCGSAVVTSAGGLPCRYVIHAVGPVMGEGDEDLKLRSATESAFDRAEELRLSTLALPAISTGIFGYPLERCAPIMLEVATEVGRRGTTLERAVFCLWGDEAFATFQRELQKLGA
jgi:O-acetyl-ADP-ribose deacetylase